MTKRPDSPCICFAIRVSSFEFHQNFFGSDVFYFSKLLLSLPASRKMNVKVDRFHRKEPNSIFKNSRTGFDTRREFTILPPTSGMDRIEVM